jgi:hypothetical protein
MISTSIKVDDREFQKAYRDYVSFSKKSLEDIANKTAYEIAKLATKTTKFAEKEKIGSDLRQSRGGATLAEMIVASNRKKAGLKGLAGQQMEKAVETFIKKRQRTAKFILSGWIAAVRAIAPYVSQKSGGMPQGNRVKSSLGGSQAAKESGYRATAVIWNSVMGGKREGGNPAQVTQVQQEGLNKAIAAKKNDMIVYINRKLDEGAKRFWR